MPPIVPKLIAFSQLYLYQNGIGIHGSDGIKALSSAISKNTQMRVLNLSDNSLKEEGGIEVARTLKWIPQLKVCLHRMFLSCSYYFVLLMCL